MSTTDPRVLLVADFTIAGLAPHLERAGLTAAVAPYGQVMSCLLDPALPCWQPAPDFAVVWTRPQATLSAFARVLNNEPASLDEGLAEVDRFVDALKQGASRVSAMFVTTWALPSYERGLGLLNWDTQIGPAYWLARLNLRLAERVHAEPGIHLLDAGRWLAKAGEQAVSPKLWHLGKIAVGPDVFAHAATDINAAIQAVRGRTRKMVVVDLDDTLWGGIVGDVGWEDLRLGGHDPVGEAFVAFQRGLQRLTRRGVVLAIASKNTEAVALEAIDRHPDMVLRRQDFAAWRINWDDKAKNIAELAAEMNLGLDSIVFIDDNLAERARVRDALPGVLVPDWPSDTMLWEQSLAELTCFDATAVTDEDRARTRMYVSERERTLAKTQAQSLTDYLASLGLTVTVERLGPSTLPRATQLLNKTNQMNLRTRRLTEQQFSAWNDQPGQAVFVVRVADRFDDYGLTGIASLEVRDGRADVADYVLSCRVMGRGVEETMLAVLVEQARALGARELALTFAATAKNAPCRLFLDERSGLRRDDPATYVWDLALPYPAPSHVAVRSAPLPVANEAT